MFAAVWEFSGLAPSAVLDKSSTGSAAGSGTTANWASGATATTSQAAEVWAGVSAGYSSVNQALTPPGAPWVNSPLSATVAGLFLRFAAGYQVTTSAGPASYTCSYGGVPATWGASVVTLLPATPAVAPRGARIDPQAVRRAAYW
jgi:hypothetical protein